MTLVYIDPRSDSCQRLQHNYSPVNDYHKPIMSHYLVPKQTVDTRYRGDVECMKTAAQKCVHVFLF